MSSMFGRFTYVVLEVSWAMPIILGQWAIAWRTLWPCRLVVFAGLAIPTVYLSLADGVAILNGIWTLHRNRIMGIYLGVVPIEEVLFFLLTNAMVAQSVVLFTEGRVGARRSPARYDRIR